MNIRARCILHVLLTIVFIRNLSAGPDNALTGPCKLSKPGREFGGNIGVTRGGIPCQSWSSQTPHEHGYNQAYMFPDGGTDLYTNRCRNPDPNYSEGPWCFTTDPKVRWDLCDIPFCQVLTRPCKISKHGREFGGNIGVTKSGIPCQSWESQTPHKHGYNNAIMFPDGDVAIASNRCRNPDSEYQEGPWCFTTDPNVRWRLCDIPFCEVVDEFATQCKVTEGGHEYAGEVAITKSGKSCQSWESNMPHRHRYNSRQYFATLPIWNAGNKCRNPEPNMNRGPWCFTMDPTVRWEECKVSKCKVENYKPWCPAGFRYPGGSNKICYKVINKGMSWHDARENCIKQAHGSHLAVVQSIEQNIAITRLISEEQLQTGRSNGKVNTVCRGQGYWLAGHRKDDADCFTDMTWSPYKGYSANMLYNNFYPAGRPKCFLKKYIRRASETCVTIYHYFDYYWLAKLCYQLACSVCQVQPA